MNPNGESSEVDRQLVEIDPLDAESSDGAAQQLAVIDHSLIGKFAQMSHRRGPQSSQFPLDAWQRTSGQILLSPLLDVVDGGYKEMDGAHGDIRDAEVEESFGRVRLVESS